MKLFVSKFNIVFLILFMISTPALPGTLHIWTDENGVTHMTSQPPPDNSEHEKINYKKKKDTYKPSSNNFNYLRRKEAERNANIRQLKSERKFEEAKSERKKQRQLRELEKAKEKYEDYELRRHGYEDNYREASSPYYKNYWLRKIKKADKAESEYYKLKNQSGN